MYCESGTVDRSTSSQLADADAYPPGRRFMCTHQVATLLA